MSKVPEKIHPLGGKKIELPHGYTRLNYLEGKGNQWIDTGLYVTPHCDMRIDITACCMAPYGRSQTLFGVQRLNFPAVNRAQFAMLWLDTYDSFCNCRIEWGGQDIYYHNVLSDTSGNTFYRMYCDGSRFVAGDGEIDVVADYTNILGDEQAGSCLLFAVRRDLNPYNPFIGRVTYCLISYDNTPAAEFIPALDPEGVPCMYDNVRKKPYYNQGGGQFAYG